MPGNGDFEAKCPAIWEFDFIKTLEAQRFFLGKCSQRVMAWHSRPKDCVLLHAFGRSIHVLLCGEGQRRWIAARSNPQRLSIGTYARASGPL